MKRCLLNPYTFQVFNIFFFWTTVYALFHAVLFHFLCKFSVVYHKSSKKETATSRRKISKISPVYCAFLHAHENDLLFLYLTSVPLSISKTKWGNFRKTYFDKNWKLCRFFARKILKTAELLLRKVFISFTGAKL